ncbi:MAG: NADH-quinone oxidoreductase subunit A [Methanosarcinales archaeon]|jgi:NADH-quinone oxidoreductase subunit A
MENIIDIYIPVAVFVIFGLAIPLICMFLVKQLSPRSKNPVKFTTYESGSVPSGSANIMFNTEYYIYAIIFVLFDAEILFLYPWVTVYMNDIVIKNVDGFSTGLAVAEMTVFMIILLLGLIYEWKKGALEWVR